MLDYEELRARMASLRDDVSAGRMSFYEFVDVIEDMYKGRPLTTTKPSRKDLLDVIIEDIQWWCIRHEHDYEKLLVSWQHSKVVLHKDGTATIELRSKERRLMAYFWSPKFSLWTNEFKASLVSPKLRWSRQGRY